jgi:uncharacterized membrane protein
MLQLRSACRSFLILHSSFLIKRSVLTLPLVPSLPSILFPLFHRIGRIPTRYRLLLGLLLGGGVWLAAPASVGSISRGLIAWDTYAASALLLIGSAVFTADAQHIRKVATTEDPSRVVGLVFVLVAALASLGAVVALAGDFKHMSHTAVFRHALLSIVGVVEAWFLVHTVFTLHYAHLYYDDCGPGGSDARGIEFPGDDPEPDYLDFAYFAFTIGMAAQTADVTISGKRQRRTALLHSLISFSFNTALVALSIGALGGLLKYS